MSQVNPQEGDRVRYMSPDGGLWDARIERVNGGDLAEVNLRYGDRLQLAENVPYSSTPERGTWGRPRSWSGKPTPGAPKVEVS